MEQGSILEEYAVPFYEMTFNEDLRRVAFVTTDSGKYGCSPDALIGDDETGGGLEIKCPLLKTHVKYLMEGKLPDDYKCQVHGSMFVTGRKWWKFMSYFRGHTPFVLRIDRDEEIMKKIETALEKFYKKFNAEYARLKAYPS